jgi:addiction module HigA family antidote
MAIKNGLPPIHPGIFLKEILDELGVSQNTFAHAVGVSPMRISHVINGSRPVTAELAVLFGKVFGQTPTYWMNLQTSYDLKTAEKVMVQRMRQVQPLLLAA